MDKSHIFISYFHDNEEQTARLRNDLIEAGEKVWWDKDLLPGQNWKLAIRKAMTEAYAVVVCFSEESARRNRAGVYPELRDAIDMLRQYGPETQFLFPICFSECPIPNFLIDSTTMLSDIQYVKLYPEEQRSENMDRLLAAIRMSPAHPNQQR